MSTGLKRTVELLEHLIDSKENLVDTLVNKGEDASSTEPFDDLVQKAGDYIPKTYILLDSSGNEIPGVLVSQETVFDATVNDVREGKVFASDLGVGTGEKVIPSYNTSEGIRLIPAGETLFVRMQDYEYTKFQAIICPFNSTMSNSVSAERVVIEDNVYKPHSTVSLSLVRKNGANGTIDLGITNDFGKPCLIRFFSYKEIY